MNFKHLLAAPLIVLALSMGHAVLANPLPLTHPLIQQLLGDPGLASVLADQGVIAPAVDPSLPGGLGVAVDCQAAQDFIDEMNQIIEDAKGDWLWEYAWHDAMIEDIREEPGYWTDEDFLEQAEIIAEAHAAWLEAMQVLDPVIGFVNTLMNAAGC